MKKTSLAVAALLTTLSVATIVPAAYADSSSTPSTSCGGSCVGCKGCNGCRTAGIGCVDCKRPVIEAIGRELQPIQEAIKEYEADLGLVKRIVVEGSEQAREEANKTLNDVRDVMKLDY